MTTKMYRAEFFASTAGLFEKPSTSTGREEFAMKQYRILFGAYVRMYADYTIEAESDEDARRLAIEEFKDGNDELDWYDAQYDNIAQPSIVSIQDNETNDTVLEGFDFPITASDARDYASAKMLEALEFVRMTFADIEASKRKGHYARCPKIVDEAIAEATVIKDRR